MQPCPKRAAQLTPYRERRRGSPFLESRGGAGGIDATSPTAAPEPEVWALLDADARSTFEKALGKEVKRAGRLTAEGVKTIAVSLRLNQFTVAEICAFLRARAPTSPPPPARSSQRRSTTPTPVAKSEDDGNKEDEDEDGDEEDTDIAAKAKMFRERLEEAKANLAKLESERANLQEATTGKHDAYKNGGQANDDDSVWDLRFARFGTKRELLDARDDYNKKATKLSGGMNSAVTVSFFPRLRDIREFHAKIGAMGVRIDHDTAAGVGNEVSIPYGQVGGDGDQPCVFIYWRISPEDKDSVQWRKSRNVLTVKTKRAAFERRMDVYFTFFGKAAEVEGPAVRTTSGKGAKAGKAAARVASVSILDKLRG